MFYLVKESVSRTIIALDHPDMDLLCLSRHVETLKPIQSPIILQDHAILDILSTQTELNAKPSHMLRHLLALLVRYAAHQESLKYDLTIS